MRVELFGISFFSGSFRAAVDLLIKHSVSAKGAPWVVVTPNVDHVVRLDSDQKFRDIYMQSDMYFADGAPLILASRLLRKPLKERITGADLMPALLERLSIEKNSVVVIGGSPGEECDIEMFIKTKYPGLVVRCFCPSLDFDPESKEAELLVVKVAKENSAGIFICIGAPKQELLAFTLKENGIGRVHICCGAALDFLRGKVKRAPVFIQRIGFEWAWRLLSEPRRLWRRYLIEDMHFLKMLFFELIKR